MAVMSVEIAAGKGDRYDEVLTDQALSLVADLQRRFGASTPRG
jgi:hypothetical protein